MRAARASSSGAVSPVNPPDCLTHRDVIRLGVDGPAAGATPGRGGADATRAAPERECRLDRFLDPLGPDRRRQWSEEHRPGGGAAPHDRDPGEGFAERQLHVGATVRRRVVARPVGSDEPELTDRRLEVVRALDVFDRGQFAEQLQLRAPLLAAEVGAHPDAQVRRAPDVDHPIVPVAEPVDARAARKRCRERRAWSTRDGRGPSGASADRRARTPRTRSRLRSGSARPRRWPRHRRAHGGSARRRCRSGPRAWPACGSTTSSRSKRRARPRVSTRRLASGG